MNAVHQTARRIIQSRLARFALVGVGGLAVDASVLWIMLRLVHLGPYYGRLASFLAAATFTWWGNRRLTFPDRVARTPGAMLKEWARFVFANGFGGMVNYGVYAGLVRFAPAPANNPYVALIYGAAAGLVLNFTLSQLVVFRHPERSGGSTAPPVL